VKEGKQVDSIEALTMYDIQRAAHERANMLCVYMLQTSRGPVHVSRRGGRPSPANTSWRPGNPERQVVQQLYGEMVQ